MGIILQAIPRLRIWKDTGGQDLVEYALLAGFVAVATGVFAPDLSASISTIYSKLASKLVQAQST
jgi:pilus assembly protein Flp/PilA